MNAGNKILLIILLTLSTYTVSSQNVEIVGEDGNPIEDVYVGNTFKVKILEDGQPISSLDVFFTLNNSAPIHTVTDNNGITVYKPLNTGDLVITALKHREWLKEVNLTVTENSSKKDLPKDEDNSKKDSKKSDGGSSGSTAEINGNDLNSNTVAVEGEISSHEESNSSDLNQESNTKDNSNGKLTHFIDLTPPSVAEENHKKDFSKQTLNSSTSENTENSINRDQPSGFKLELIPTNIILVTVLSTIAIGLLIYIWRV